MTANEKIAAALQKVRRIWLIQFLAFFFLMLVYAPGWPVLLVIPYGVLTHLIGIFIAINMLEGELTENDIKQEENLEKMKEIHERLQRGEIKHGPELFQLLHEAGALDIQKVVATSEEVVGIFNGQTMYEWVDIEDPHTKKRVRYTYYGPSRPEAPFLPSDKTKVFATVDGIIYARDAQPV